MNSEHHDEEPNQKSWLERLSQAFSSTNVDPQSKDHILQCIKHASSRGFLDIDSVQMLEGVLIMDNLRVRDVMIPRAQMEVLHYDIPLSDLIDTVIQSGHSRFPVVEEDKDEIIGLLLAKDLLRYCRSSEEFNIDQVLRKPMIIPESKRLNALLREFKQSRNHMAIVIDEFGGVAGLITIEDVLEQIVGEIDDEHDKPEEMPIKLVADKENVYLVNATIEVDDFNKFFKSNFPDDEVDTIGGYLIHHLGYLPRKDEHIHIDTLNFKVVEADNRRLYVLEVWQDDMSLDIINTTETN